MRRTLMDIWLATSQDPQIHRPLSAKPKREPMPHNPLLLEAVTATGCALILVGIATIYLPAALITAGLMLIALATITYAWNGTEEQGEP